MSVIQVKEYTQKPVKVLAVQWTGAKDTYRTKDKGIPLLPNDSGSPSQKKTICQKCGDELGNHGALYSVLARTDIEIVCPGDYIVVNSSGVGYSVIANKVFKETHEGF